MGHDAELLAASGVTGGGGYNIPFSVETGPGAFSRVPSVAGDRKKWTFSTWGKLSSLGANSSLFTSGQFDANRGSFAIESASGKLRPSIRTGGAWRYLAFGTTIFTADDIHRNFVFRYDSANAVAADRIQIDVDGVAETMVVGTNLPQNLESTFNGTFIQAIAENAFSSSPWDGLFSDSRFIGGQLLPSTSFGEFNGPDWVPIEYIDPISTNGFFLDYGDNSTAAALGTDVSGNGNDLSENNIFTTDQSTDTPTNPA